ncbi:alpha/beta hydrolase fold domain-containing protein [Streptomyces rishiriensis]|uniref:alpha/beta hydrolase fold domain-containing protein n=1 Tax=Streptomyces rishiriensis TaxID=68264 RepID=UPI0037D611EA
MAVSRQAHEFAEFLADVSAKSSTPGLDLAVIRDIVDSHHKASTEPEGVSYAEVDAGGVPALWAVPEGADPDKALLHFHFGGSVTASMHSDRKAAGHIAKAAGARSLVVDFRLAPEHPHPAQLDDAEAAYRWLLAQGYQPRNIGSTGHSIGGTLAVLLPLRLLAKGEATPGAIVSVSPWTDLTLHNPSVDENEDNDKMLSRATLELFRAAWLQEPGVDFTDPRISIADADLTGLPPTTVHYGAYETLADDGAALGRRLADFKVTSEVHALPEGQHSFILGAGRVPEVDQAIQRMGQWLRLHLGN